MGEAHCFSSFFFWFFFSLKKTIFILLQRLIHIALQRNLFCSILLNYKYICLAGNKRKQALLRSNLSGIFPVSGHVKFFDNSILFIPLAGLNLPHTGLCVA
jgi:hypothetical protein